MLSALELCFRQKQYYCLYLFFTVTEKSSSDKQALSCLLSLNREAAPPAPSPWAAVETAGGWEGTLAGHPCMNTPHFYLSQHLLLTAAQYGTAGLMDLCSDPLWMMCCCNLSEKASWTWSLIVHLAPLILKASMYNTNYPSSPLRLPRRDCSLILLFIPVCWKEKATAVIIYSYIGHV